MYFSSCCCFVIILPFSPLSFYAFCSSHPVGEFPMIWQIKYRLCNKLIWVMIGSRELMISKEFIKMQLRNNAVPSLVKTMSVHSCFLLSSAVKVLLKWDHTEVKGVFIEKLTTADPSDRHCDHIWTDLFFDWRRSFVTSEKCEKGSISRFNASTGYKLAHRQLPFKYKGVPNVCANGKPRSVVFIVKLQPVN